MATTMNKNKVSDLAKDFGMASKDILSVLSAYEDGSKKPSQVLSADEINLIFEHLTQKNQVTEARRRQRRQSRAGRRGHGPPGRGRAPASARRR